ncbi:MAG: gliding motility protein GldN [Bacteroidales bacterium]|nr:gliding motility protein GldN [Bacteroidales bacterium]
MKKLIFLIVIGLTTSFAFAQQKQSDVLDGVYVKEHVPARKPVPYHHLREADMMWGKKIWRMLDLREKINHPLYFPTRKMDDRYSLTELLLYGIENEGLVAYSDVDDEFTTPLTIAEINSKLGAKVDSQYVDDEATGTQVLKVIPGERKPEEVTRYLMKEYWYFDKQRSMLEVRIIGIAPIRMYARDAAIGEETQKDADEGDEKELEMKLVMWIYFPAARPLLANHEVFNPYNDSERRTFDDIFFKRRFISFIYQETNVYNNRFVWQYKSGLDAMLESERIKDFMFKVEHDLWEY